MNFSGVVNNVMIKREVVEKLTSRKSSSSGKLKRTISDQSLRKSKNVMASQLGFSENVSRSSVLVGSDMNML